MDKNLLFFYTGIQIVSVELHLKYKLKNKTKQKKVLSVLTLTPTPSPRLLVNIQQIERLFRSYLD